MSGHRVQHLLTINRAWWLIDVKRQDPYVPAKVLNKYLKQKQTSLYDGIGERGKYLAVVNSPRVDEWCDHVLFSRRSSLGKSTFSSSSTQMLGKSIYPCPFGATPLRRTKSLVTGIDDLKIQGVTQDSHIPEHQNALRQEHYLNAEPNRSKSQSDPDPEPKGQEGGVNGKPSVEQLMHVYHILQDTLPKLFLQPMNYKIYRQDLVFVNNLINKTTYGLMKYVQQVALLRTIGHLRFAYVRFELISMSPDNDEGRITVRWRIAGISGLRVMLKFWKFKLWKYQELMSQQEIWYDGISYFDVGSDGLVSRHIADKVEEDKDRLVVDKSGKSPLIAKLAIMASLFPRSGFQDALAFQSSSTNDSCIRMGQKGSAGSKDLSHLSS